MGSLTTADVESVSDLPSVTSSGATTPEVGLTENEKLAPGCQRPLTIRMPDLFSSILSVKAVVNPHYEAVKAEGDRWIADLLEMDEKAAKKNSKVDFAYMTAIWSPTSNAEALRTILDWNHWIFFYDDLYDEGCFKDDFPAAKAEVEANIAIMNQTAPRYSPNETEYHLKLRYAFQSCSLVQRFQKQHQSYFNGILNQVEQQSSGRSLTRDIDEYVAMRRGTIGADPTIALLEYGEGIELPAEPFEHPSFREFMVVGTDLTWLANDIMSFRKDLELGVDHNLISLLMEQGRTMQEAVDRIGEMINDCYRRWYKALLELPIFGEEVDREALRFMDACRNVALGSLHWSFQTGRYWGDEGDVLRKTRIMHLPPQKL
ncbi:hypothetical protein diail_4655 [Diaporthe ilicicola]|nr:hypothetical protein diail_4655 [Diaporthe ilicicola]